MVKTEKIIPGGQALGTLEDGKKIFFWNALPDEVVSSYDTTKNKTHFVEAIATKISHPSPHRIQPEDSCYLSTSPWQIMDYDYELKLKQELVVEIFREHQIEISAPDIITDGRDYHYRNKMEYALYWNNETNKINLAFHARGSHRKIPINQSSIEHPELFAHASKIIDELNQKHDEARKYQSLLLRCNQAGEISGGLFENGRPHPNFKNLTDQILNYTYSYSLNGFFQINLPVYEMALKEIKKYISTDKVLDLYAGVGTIGLSVARDRHLTLVECDNSAFVELSRNCKEAFVEPKNGTTRGLIGGTAEIEGASPVTTGASDPSRESAILGSNSTNPYFSCYHSKSEDALSYIERDQTVIVDPPRAGCDAKLINKLLEVKPPKIIYLSCNPATQARDIKQLLTKYHIEDVKTFNFFPRTPHIENLIVLSL